MRLLQLLESEIIKFPSDQAEPTYSETIERRFTEYRDAIARLEPSPIGDLIKQASGKIDNLCTAIEESISAHLLGNTHQSYEALKKGISYIDPEFRAWYSIPIGIDESISKKLFRIRTSNKIISDKSEMFHIPFNLRHLVKTQRYSIPGVPCLYFGSSSYIAWKEMGEPALDSVYISRFETRKPVKVLNFGYDHRWIKDILTEPQIQNNPDTLIGAIAVDPNNNLVKQAVSWFAILPLLIATSIRRKIPGTDFCDAYILTQNLMQFIRNDKFHNIDGIRFVSTRFKDEIQSLTIPHSWAFPVKTTGYSGHCTDLKSAFSNTVLQSWQFVDQYANVDTSGISQENIEYMPGHIQAYNSTIWGKSDASLMKMPATPI